MAVNPGYMGLCTIDDVKIRVTDFSVNVSQEVEFYDHIIGLRDNFPGPLRTKGDEGVPNPVTGDINIQKYAWRPGVKICSGSISFPATYESLRKTFYLAKTGDDFTIIFNYACNDVQRTFTYCKVNSYSFSISAGEILTITLDVMGRFMEEDTGFTPYDETEKLLTWDSVSITTLNSSDPVFSFNFTVNNNCSPIYTAGANASESLFPKKIRVGMQEVTGSIVYYIKGIDYKGLSALTTFNGITLKVKGSCDNNDFVQQLCVIYKPIERASSIGALLHTLPFVGVGKALGIYEPWVN